MRSTDIAHTTPLRRDLPPFRTGDTVRVHVKIREGEKERIQVFEGVVLRRKQGGRSATFTVRKLSYGVGVERVFATESPTVAKLEIKQRGHVRRSRLYYLRELRGKKARLRSKVRDLSSLISEEAASAKAAPPEGAAASEPGTAAAAAAIEEAATEGAAANEAAPEAGEVEASAEAAEEPNATAEAAEEPEKTDA
ncbi:MAG: 50S ribosomal protein L19 [Deltaproteobacteria bacterium]|nr:50S ribosomal protein L19 [Deltaproteobacteria bacterium]